MSESNSFTRSVDHDLSQLSHLNKCANIFSIVVSFLLTVQMYNIPVIIISVIAMESAIVMLNWNYINFKI